MKTPTEQDVDDILENSQAEWRTMGKKTTVVTTTLPGGFEITVSSSAADPARYNHAIGIAECDKKTRIRVWELLAYQAAASSPLVERLQASIQRLETIKETHPEISLSADLAYYREVLTSSF